MAGYLAYIQIIDGGMGGGAHPDHTLPGMPVYPSQGPGFPTHPIAPGGQPPYPSQGPGFPTQLPMPGGQPGQPTHPWVPPPGKPEHPIVLPPGTTPPNLPTHPIEGVSWGFAIVYIPGQATRWTAFPVEDAAPDQGLPGGQPHPDQGLPGSQPHPDNSPPGPQPTPTPQRR